MKKEKPPRKPEGGQADIQPKEETLWKTHRDGDEYARCAADPFYYVERYVHIECPEAQTLLQPFRLWPAQRPALEAMATRRRVMVLKARQLGMTWLALAEASRLLLCRPGRTVVCISRAENEARELVRRLGVIFGAMPRLIQPERQAPEGWEGPVFRQNRMDLTIRFADGPPSVCRAFATSPGAARGFTADLILLDEWAFQPGDREVWASLLPLVNRPGGGRVIGLSTIRRGSLFERLYKDPDCGFEKLFLPWTADPGRDTAWYKATQAALGEDRTCQEYPASAEEALSIRGGSYFPEVRRASHHREHPPEGPLRRVAALDYGLDMLSVHWIALDERGNAWVYREYDAPDQTIGAAAAGILSRSGAEPVEQYLAPPDLWARSQESGRGRADLFWEAGLPLVKASNAYADGCAAMKEWLAPGPNGPALTIDKRACPRLWECLQQVQKDEADPNVYAKTPHDLTHDLDSLRYFCVSWQPPARPLRPALPDWEPDLWEDYENADEAGRAYLYRKYGGPPAE